jgi:hypothetical protein
MEMAQEVDTLMKKGGDILRELAVHQGSAYRRYGEALEKFGSGESSATELFKTAGDLYFREAGHIGAGLFAAASEVVNWALGKAIPGTTSGDVPVDPQPAVKIRRPR